MTGAFSAGLLVSAVAGIAVGRLDRRGWATRCGAGRVRTLTGETWNGSWDKNMSVVYDADPLIVRRGREAVGD